MNRQQMADVMNEADYRWQHGIGSGGYDMNEDGYFLMLADALVEAGVK